MTALFICFMKLFIFIYFSTEYEDVIESHMEKMPDCGNGAMWRCRTCFKMHKKKGDMRRHCETHIEGLSYTCTQCGVEKNQVLLLECTYMLTTPPYKDCFGSKLNFE